MSNIPHCLRSSVAAQLCQLGYKKHFVVYRILYQGQVIVIHPLILSLSSTVNKTMKQTAIYTFAGVNYPTFVGMT